MSDEFGVTAVVICGMEILALPSFALEHTVIFCLFLLQASKKNVYSFP
jgi:hypothetical protein